MLGHVPVSPWGLNNGVSSSSVSPCLQTRRREAAVLPLLRPESGTKTRPRPNRSRAPSRYAHSSGSEAGSRFFTPKNGGEKGGGKVAGSTHHSSLITFHFKMAGSEGTLKNIIHHSSFIIHHSLCKTRAKPYRAILAPASAKRVWALSAALARKPSHCATTRKTKAGARPRWRCSDRASAPADLESFCPWSSVNRG